MILVGVAVEASTEAVVTTEVEGVETAVATVVVEVEVG